MKICLDHLDGDLSIKEVNDLDPYSEEKYQQKKFHCASGGAMLKKTTAMIHISVPYWQLTCFGIENE